MKRTVQIALVLVVLGIFLPQSFVFAENLTPEIVSISPSTVYLGEEVEISGTNFGDSNSNNENFVFQNGQGSRQTIINWSNTSIVVKVDNVSWAYVGDIELRVGITNQTDRTTIFSNPIPLKIQEPTQPTIKSIMLNGDVAALDVPGRPPAKLDDQIQIYGYGFGVNKGTLLFEGTNFNNTSQFITHWDPRQIVVYLKNLNGFPNIVDLSVVNINSQKSNAVQLKIQPPAPACTADTWSCSDWNVCSVSGTQTRNCTKTFDCPTATTPSPVTTQDCTPPCSTDTWSCEEWSQCSSDGTQNRSCTKTFDCPSAYTPSPSTSQSCTPPPPPQPACTADTWTCGTWGACSLSGIQNRSCTKTFDCSSVETAPPITAQYCETPNRPTQQIPQDSSDQISNQAIIIKSTVKLLCPFDAKRANQGSGTVIDSGGTILTNKHVVAGTLGCLVGFINDFNDEPYFGERHIADILKVSPNLDIAILKMRNPQNKRLPNVDVTKGSSDLRLGTKVSTYGFPAKFGTKITYTSGDFSGTDGNYLRTTAILEYGNSGGGAYLKNGVFVGMPSAVKRGELNAMGYILSINTINAWLGNSTITSGDTSSNQYSRVSVLEAIDLQTLNSLKLFIPETDESGDIVAPIISTTDSKTQEIMKQPQVSQTQEESTVIESTGTNQATSISQQSQGEPETEQPKKVSWVKRLLLWLINLFFSKTAE